MSFLSYQINFPSLRLLLYNSALKVPRNVLRTHVFVMKFIIQFQLGYGNKTFLQKIAIVIWCIVDWIEVYSSIYRFKCHKFCQLVPLFMLLSLFSQLGVLPAPPLQVHLVHAGPQRERGVLVHGVQYLEYQVSQVSMSQSKSQSASQSVTFALSYDELLCLRHSVSQSML